MDKRILFLREIILDKLQLPPTIEELAVHINVSPARIRQLFKTETGMPIGEYIHHLQMEHACQLLKTTFMRVQEISLIVGFHDQSYFNRSFKKKYGLAPNKYRDTNHQSFKKLNRTS